MYTWADACVVYYFLNRVLNSYGSWPVGHGYPLLVLYRFSKWQFNNFINGNRSIMAFINFLYLIRAAFWAAFRVAFRSFAPCLFKLSWQVVVSLGWHACDYVMIFKLLQMLLIALSDRIYIIFLELRRN